MTQTPIPEDARKYVEAIRVETFERMSRAVKMIQEILDEDGITAYVSSQGERIDTFSASLRFWAGMQESLDRAESIEDVMRDGWFHVVPDNWDDRSALQGLLRILFPLDDNTGDSNG
jgi:hypothetical protein